MSLTKSLTNFVTKTASRTMLQTKKHSPEILVGVGIAAMVGGTILAIRATMKCEQVLDERQEKLDHIERAIEIANDGHPNAVSYTEEDVKKDKLIVTIQTTFDFVRLYWPAFTCVIGGAVCILAGYNILKKRNAAVVAALKAVDEAFKQYRKRVVEDLGVDKDLEYRYGAKKETVEIETIDEKGKKTKAKEERLVIGGQDCSMYARLFEKGKSSQWSPHDDYNRMYIEHQQGHANELLMARGHVFLSEVYDILGFERTPESIVVGWVRGNGDNYIEFEMRDVYVDDPTVLGGRRHSILLDFNVDGVVYDLIG